MGARKRKVSGSKGWYIRICIDKRKSAFHPPAKRERAFFEVHYRFTVKNPQSPRPPLSYQKSLGQLDLYPKKGEKKGIRARALKHYKWVHFNLNNKTNTQSITQKYIIKNLKLRNTWYHISSIFLSSLNPHKQSVCFHNLELQGCHSIPLQ